MLVGRRDWGQAKEAVVSQQNHLQRGVVIGPAGGSGWGVQCVGVQWLGHLHNDVAALGDKVLAAA